MYRYCQFIVMCKHSIQTISSIRRRLLKIQWDLLVKVRICSSRKTSYATWQTLKIKVIINILFIFIGSKQEFKDSQNVNKIR